MKKHIYFLDSLRGIAAVTVVLAHFAETYSTNPIFKELFEPLGRSAVILFFVLSGIALSLSLEKMNELRFRTYFSYLIKRFCRIYIPFFVIILLAEVIFAILQPEGISGLSAWFNNVGSRYNDMHTVVSNLLMLGQDVDKIDPVIWSLIIELRISIIFPVLYIFVKRNNIYVSMVALFASFFIGLALLMLLNSKLLIGATVFNVGFFIAGILLSLHWQNIMAFSARVKIFLLSLAIILYLHVSIFNLLGVTQKQAISDVVIGVACVTILLLCYQTERAQKYLENKVFLWLGKISFSVYLVHCVVFIPAIYILTSFGVSIGFIQLISVPFILGVATIYYQLIEKQSIHIGRYLSNNLKSGKEEYVVHNG
ncbi:MULTISPECIES: acyltransferase [Listeria]|uniref:acyltransferase family protein n=1 Tax=Listeria TaxID=1637 RepID=UPI0013567029|nr:MULTISPECIES: acyltransferase [Listeria]